MTSTTTRPVPAAIDRRDASARGDSTTAPLTDGSASPEPARAHGNTSFRFTDAGLLSVVAVEAPVAVPSSQFDEWLAPARRRLHLPRNLLQRVAGVKERRWWKDQDGFRQGAIDAGERALAEAGVDRSEIDLMINTSVTRPHLEPSVAVSIHAGLGLPTSAMNFDVTNACLGFINGITLAASMIDAGQIRYALIVDSEDTEATHRGTIDRLNADAASRDDYNHMFATLTLGSGAAAAIIGPRTGNPAAHAINGCVSRAASENYDLCVGSVGDMRTDTKALLSNGLDLVMDCWNEAHEDGWNWRDVALCVTHQVSTIYTRSFAKASGLALDKLPVTFPRWGNVGPAALPMTLAEQQREGKLHRGDNVLLLGVGSGLNTTMMDLTW